MRRISALGRTLPRVRELKQHPMPDSRLSSSRTLPRVRELKPAERLLRLPRANGRTPPGVRELNH